MNRWESARVIEFRLLGPVEIRVDGRPVELRRPQLRAVLAALAVEAGRPVPQETLLDRVWGGALPEGARGALYSHITRLRRVLESAGLESAGLKSAGQQVAGRQVAVLRHAAGYVLDSDPDNVDLHRFRRLLALAREGSRTDRERSLLLREALGLWRGLPLADVRGDWADLSRVGWRQQRLDAAVTWAQVELRLGGGDEVLGTVRELLVEYPLAEPLAAAQMRALAAAGRIAEALECYVAVRARLVAELGTEPGLELQAAHQAVLRGEAGPAQASAAPAPPPGGPDGSVAAPGRRTGLDAAEHPRPAQLPPPVRGFTGRLDAIGALDALLDPPDGSASTAVIAVLSGTAGIGKTALAVYWAHRVAERFPDGQLYVNLRGFDGTGHASNPAEVARQFLWALGVPAERVPAEPDAQLALYRSVLAGKRVLVVLDNARDTAQVRPLLPGSPAACTVVTSRNQLTPLVAADDAFPVTLDLLSAGEARALVERRIGYRRVSAEPAAVEQLVAGCARLPLALSIATAKAQLSDFSLAVLAAELTDAGQRLGTLDAGDPATRVRAVFSWSYHRLTPQAARLFRLLGLAAGPDISTAAAASLAGLPLPEARESLTELAQASLVTEQAPGRYAFHDLLAAYAAELAASTDPNEERQLATDRLLDHYVFTAHAADRLLNPARDPIQLPLSGPSAGTGAERLADDRAAMDWLTAEQPVLLAALRLAAGTGNDTQVWQLAWGLDTFLLRRGHWHERAEAWHDAVAAAERLSDPVAAAHALRDLARVSNQLGRHSDARGYLVRALGLFADAGDPIGQAHTHRVLASLSEREGRPDRALHHDQQALDLFRAAGHVQGQADALNSVGWDHSLLGDHAQALACCEQALVLHQETGDRWGEATTWDSLGHAHHHLDHHADAVDCYERALVLVRELGDRYFEADTLARLGDTHRAAGAPGAARVAWESALAILTDLGHAAAGDVRAKLAGLDSPASQSPASQSAMSPSAVSPSAVSEKAVSEKAVSEKAVSGSAESPTSAGPASAVPESAA
ncbi:AfsR/SARP family transcriptional regulator [Rugosimonospora africana]|uniref:SARP family transcriptional regulator n=1 Tax=Rugosimonospora africana TaxID=556532 RepID=A0A8J3R2H2_9ACTN|nr:BTAD domain-containing putative transcriptional regulator [Rugosimonospora africana]GIH20662.1 SARP family transcriptional regulator [Rugosimonospora africana]